MEKDDKFTWTLQDAFEGVQFIAHIDKNVIPNLVSKDFKKAKLNKTERIVFIAVAMIGEFSPDAKKVGQRVQVGASMDEIQKVSKLLEAYEDGMKLDIIGPLVALMKKGELSSIGAVK